jgi:transcriptional regulator PpsR
VRIARAHASLSPSPADETRLRLLAVVDNAPDAFVLTDNDGLILSANAAFVDMAQLASEDQARGESLDRWLGQSALDLSVLITNVRQRGTIRFFATSVRGENGATAQVEVSAVAVADGGKQNFGFAIRNVGPRLRTDQRIGRDLPRSVEQLTELIGRVALKDLVREATDVIERLCIEAALELTGDNRASAAEMLGLSRQSLYVKLRRYGLGDLDTDGRDQRE